MGDFSNRWSKQENVEPDALREWRIGIFKVIDAHVSFYSRSARILPPGPGSSFGRLGRGGQGFHINYVSVPADKKNSK